MNTAAGARPRTSARPRKPIFAGFVLFGVVVLLIAALGWCRWVYGQIEWYAGRDQAMPSDAIAVFGAAEYDGHPSPVFRARLDHAESLYNRGIAPLIITLGGTGEISSQRARLAAIILLAKACLIRTLLRRRRAQARTSLCVAWR